MAEPLLEPSLTVIEVLIGVLVLATQKDPTNTAADRVIIGDGFE